MKCGAWTIPRGIKAAMSSQEGFPCERNATFRHYLSIKDADGNQVSDEYCWQHSRMQERSNDLIRVVEIQRSKETMQKKVCEIYGLPSELAD